MTGSWFEFYSEFFRFSGVQSGFGQKFDISLFMIMIKRGILTGMLAYEKFTTRAVNTQVVKCWTCYKSSSR